MQIKRESLAFVLIASIIITCSAVGAVQVFSTTVPICFIQNDGQTDDQVFYFADGAGYTLYLTAEGEVISTADPVSVVEITYPGSTAAIAVSGENELPGKANFLIGNDEEQWVTNVPLFSSVRYDGLYEGISLVYYGGVSTLKKEFVISPGADPSAIRMQYAGQDGLALDEEGALLVTTAAGTFFETPPVSYQIVDGAQVGVPSSFVLGEDSIVTFAVGAYDRTLPLVIDPQYNFSTYLGGTQDDKGAGVGMDDLGNVYVVGSTQSTEFPLANASAFQEHLNGSWDIFASKFSPDGTQLLYSTYFGGKSEDLAYGMVVNNLTQEVTFTGSTKSTDYPNSYPGFQSYSGTTDAIVTRLNAAGNNYVWSRLINGNKTDVGTAVTLDDYFYNDAVVVGYTSSNNLSSSWLTSGPPLNGAAPDGFVIVITSAGIYSRGRYLGSPANDFAYGVAVDPAFGYDVWITGYTNSFDGFPTTPSAFRKENRGGYDVFITRLNWGDLSLGASTYLGGASNDYGMGIDYDGNGYPYVTGYTESPISPINLFPVMPNPTGFQTSFGGGQWDAFITKMQRDLSSMNYSTYLGGADEDKAYGIAVDTNGTAFVTGYTMSTNFPTKYPTQATKGEGFRVPDAFITQMNQTGTGLLFSTYLGGTYFDEGRAISITPDGLNITVTGYTESINFPIVNAYQPYLAGFSAVRFTDAFVTKIVKVVPVVNFTGTPQTGCRPLTVYFNDTSTNNPTSWLWDFGDNNTSPLQNPNHTYITTGGAKNFTVNLTACNIDGCGFLSQPNFTRVCPPPFADFNATNVTGCLNWTNTTIQFNVTSYSGGVKTGPAKVWNWSWGDGTYNLTNFSNVNMSHNYTKVNGTSNFTVTLTYENTCCNNTTTKLEYIDIRDKPNASFYAVPTSGLIPLDVKFNDTSTGRPSSWYWMFGAQQGTSTEQNPEHTYTKKGAYTVKLQACNYCGCDWENKTNYIMAGIPNLTFYPGTLVVPTNDTTPITLKLQVAEYGLSGYDLNVFWDDSVHGDITAVQFPPWATNTSYTPLPNYFVQIQAVDLMDQVNPGAMNITLATFNLTGNISTFQSTINFNVTPNQLDDDDGNPIFTNTIPANITVVRLLPFPGKTLPPTDPFGNQLYYDVNGNGNIDFDDVVTYFQNMQWIRDNQYRPFFNYNGNLEVAPNYGIDFADLIMLFNKV